MEWQGYFAVALTLATLVTLVSTRISPHIVMVGAMALLSASGVLTAAELREANNGDRVAVAGLAICRQRPGTAKGVMFITLEDETGNVNVVVWTSVLERFRAALLQGQLLRVKGVVEREKQVIHVVAGYIEDNTDLLSQMAVAEHHQVPFKSRDFR